MKNLLLVKEIYTEGFKGLANGYVSLFMKVYAWFSFSLIAMAVYVFVSRAANSFLFG